jgi:geranylgeranyl reductase family protein
MRHPAKHLYDVIIVGAGPAGATLGYELARKGVDVLILEKERLPRYKPCAGGITVKTVKLLDLDISPVARQVTYGARVTYKDNREFTKWYDKPLIYMVMRDEFDYFLIQRAEEAGVVVADNQRVCQLQVNHEKVEVVTTHDTFKAEILVGADGANSIVAKSLGLRKGIELGIGIEAEISVPRERLIKWDSLMGLDLGHISGGYGWIFPKKDHLSIGIGGSLRQARRLKPGYQKVLASQDLGGYEITKLRSHFLPVRKNGMAIQQERSLLLGDAAGLVDPLTGEGIYYAIKSAQLAAPIITHCLQAGTIDLKGYQDAVAKEIMPELKASQALLRLFAWFPGLYFDAIEGSDRLWRASCHLLRGELSYISLKERLGSFQFLFDLLSK